MKLLTITTGKPRGFTLIELLVVISILSLLSTVVLGSVSKARERGQVAKAQQEFKQIASALELYRNDKGSYPPGSMVLGTLISSYLQPYLKVTPKLPAAAGNITVYYNQNPQDGGDPYGISDDFYYSCGDRAGTEPYFIYFSSGSTLLKDSFPKLASYRQGDYEYVYSSNAGLYCTFVAPK